MCGIAGVVGDLQRWSSRAGRMSARLAHRGPDDLGALSWDGQSAPICGREAPSPGLATFVHRRLSIIDTTVGGWQPMSTADGRFHIVFNGELYNYVELARELAGEGVQIRSASDTAVLLAAFSAWGVAGLPRFRGMFAFAVLDCVERTVTLARDQFGIKPLYLRDDASRAVAFASEPAPLLELEAGARAPDARGIYDYLHAGRTDHRSQTMFKTVRQLPPGHFAVLRVDDPVVVPKAYWRLPPVGAPVDLSLAKAAERTRSLLERSVELHLRSDVPIGAALSGGLDSAVIVNLIRAVAEDAEIRTFTFGSGDAFDETAWARIAAAAAGATVETTSASGSMLVDDLDDLIESLGEPFGSTSIYAQRRVFELAAASGVKVMLDGQGADETFAGYHPHVAARVAELVGGLQWPAAGSLLRRRGPAGGRTSTLVLKALSGLAPFDPSPFRRLVGAEPVPGWMNSSWFLERGVRARPTRSPGLDGRPSLPRLLRDDLETGLPALLRFEDRNSMRVSIESRVPFLDVDLVVAALSYPSELLVANDGTTKYVLREAVRGLVPSAILDRRDKIGFVAPEAAWLRELGASTPDALPVGDLSRTGPLVVERVRREWDAFVEGRAAFSPRLWRWLNLLRWAQVYDVDLDDR